MQNLYLMRRFEAERQNLIAKRGATEVNERMPFHGTQRIDPHKIVLQREGFIVDFASEGAQAISAQDFHEGRACHGEDDFR